jgi:hypothetical protein
MPASLNLSSRVLAAVLLPTLATGALAGPLDGKSYIIELSSTQYSSGYGEFLVPSLAAALDASGMKSKKGPGADVVVNIITESDVGKWVGQGDAREWLYTVDITVGISPESYMIPLDGTPVFGIRARLMTPNSDRTDELDCLTRLATRTAVANYGKKGVLQTDGSACLRK